MRIELRFFPLVVALLLDLCHAHNPLPKYTERARLLLDTEFDRQTVDQADFISSHPVLSQLTHFDLNEHKAIHERKLRELINEDEIEFSTVHDGTEYDFLLSRITHADPIPHYVYHPEEEIDPENNKYGRRLTSDFSVEHITVDCLYSGHLADDPSKKGIFSLCHEEVRAVVSLPDIDNELHIQPVKVGSQRALASWLKSNIVDTDRSCGTTSTGYDESVYLNSGENDFSIIELSTQAVKRASVSNIDIFIVNDKKRTDRYSVQAIFRQSLFLLELIRVLYSAFPGDDVINIRAVGVLSMTVRDPWRKTIIFGDSVQVDSGLLADFGSTMLKFQDVLVAADGNSNLVTDVFHLLSGEDFVNSQGNQGVVGLASVGTVCAAPDRAAGITQDLFIEANTATVFAHEIGHNLGFQHTDIPIDPADPSSNCIESNIRRIMDPSGTSAQSWSTCAAHWWSLIEGTSGARCVTVGNDQVDGFIPVQDEYCGNGIVEGDEECDCGASDCTIDGQIVGQQLDPCCDGNTCRFVSNAVCGANDECCESNCQFSPADKVCREIRDLGCDTEERCTGSNGTCPEDERTEFGTNCLVDGFDGKCFRGFCISEGKQCDAVGLTDACTRVGSGDSFCQSTSGSGIRCLANQQSCFAGSFPQISPSDGTECDLNRGCYQGSCLLYSEIPVVDVCFNFEKDSNETDIDCGGDLCLPCVAGKSCLADSDCFGTCNQETSLCEGDEIIRVEDIFDVIGNFFKDNPFIAVLFYVGVFSFVGYFIYRDVRNRMKKDEKINEIGGVRHESFKRASARIKSARLASARISARLSGAVTATAITEEIQTNTTNRAVLPTYNNPGYAPEEVYSSRASARKAAPAVDIPSSVLDLPTYQDDIEGRL